jgi:hypothetical protein
MTIHSPSCAYSVLARLRGDRRRLIAQNSQHEVLLLLVDNSSLARQLTPFFYEMSENKAFTDCIEFFPHEEGFCAAFRYHESERTNPLDQVLSGAPPSMRAAALRSLFAFLFSQDPPAPVLCDMLCSENIICSAAGNVYFVYDLRLTGQFTRQSRKKAMLLLSEAVRTICGEHRLSSADALYGLLNSGKGCDWEELYAAALTVAGELEAAVPPEEIIADTPRGQKKHPKAPGYIRLGSRHYSIPFLAGILSILLTVAIVCALALSPEPESVTPVKPNPLTLLDALYTDVLTVLDQDSSMYQEQLIGVRHLITDTSNGIIYAFSVDGYGNPRHVTEVYLCGLAEVSGFIVGTDIRPPSWNRVTAGLVEHFALRLSNLWWGQDIRVLEGTVFYAKLYTITVFYEYVQTTGGRIVFLRVEPPDYSEKDLYAEEELLK